MEEGSGAKETSIEQESVRAAPDQARDCTIPNKGSSIGSNEV